jgi:hypothetical protein
MAEADIATEAVQNALLRADGKPTPLPKSVRIGGTPRLTPNELRVIKATTGKTLENLMSDEADAMQAMVWLRLRRGGFDPTWEEAGDVEADLSDLPLDPTSGESSTTSPGSAASGDAPPGTSTP